MFTGIGWLIGVAAPLMLPWRLDVWCAAAGLGLVLARLLTRRRQQYIWCICCACLGLGRAGWTLHMHHIHILPKHLEAKTIQAVGCLSARRLYSDAHTVAFNAEVFSQGVPSFRARLYAHDGLVENISSGQCYRLVMRVKRRHGQANNGVPNRERSWFIQGVAAVGGIKANLGPVPAPTAWVAVQMRLARLRAGYQSRLNYALNNIKTKEILMQILSGDGAIRQDWRQHFVETGTIHLLAISGLHVGIVALGLRWLMKKLMTLISYMPCLIRRTCLSAQRIEVISGMSGLLMAFGYVLMAGYPFSAQRALIMVSVLIVNQMRARRLPPFGALMRACVLITCIEPESVLAIGFWLSVLAVAAMIAVNLNGRECPKLWVALKMQAAISMMTLPVLLMQFGQFAMWGSMANAFALPLFSFGVIPAAFLAWVLVPLNPWLSHVLFVLADQLVLLTQWGLGWVLRLPSAHWVFRPSSLGCVLSLFGASLLWLPLPIRLRYAGLSIWLIGLLPEVEAVPVGHAQIRILDVGQGLSVLVRTARHALLYDTGKRYRDISDMGKQVILPVLQTHRISMLNLMMISHPDIDHLGGANALASAGVVNRAMGSQHVHINGMRVEHCRAGQTWRWDGVKFEVLWPFKGHYDRNNRSCILSVRASTGQQLLLVGDIEARAEQGLLKHYAVQRLRSQVLIVPHHGSKTSSTRAFVETVRPKIAIISSGYQNPYHLPSRKIVARYQAISAYTLNTSQSGEISLNLGTRDSLNGLHQERLEHPSLYARLSGLSL